MPQTTSSEISGANIMSSNALRRDCFLPARAGMPPGVRDCELVFTTGILRRQCCRGHARLLHGGNVRSAYQVPPGEGGEGDDDEKSFAGGIGFPLAVRLARPGRDVRVAGGMLCAEWR
jgi:hypothetical protein